MKSGVPWQVIGVGRQARETAREAARRAGMSVGDWLDSVIHASAREESSHPPSDPSESDASPELPGAYPEPATGEIESCTDALERRRSGAHGEAPRAGSAAPAPSALDRALIEIAERQRALESHARPDSAAAGSVTPAAGALPRARTQGRSDLEQHLRQITSRIEWLPQPCGLDQAVGTLRDDLAEIGLMVRDAMPRTAVEALEAELRKLSERLDQTRDCVADAAVLTGIERGLAEVRDALHVLTPAENLIDLARAVHVLSHRIDAAGGVQDVSALRQLEEEVVEMRCSVAHVASSDALAALSDEVRELARKVEHAVGAAGTGVLATLEQRIAALADALETRNQRTTAVPGELQSVVDKLTDKIDQLDLARGVPETDQLWRQLIELQQTERQTQNTLELVQGTLGHLVDRLGLIESDIRTRVADSPEAKPRLSAPSASTPAKSMELAATSGAAATKGPVHRAIDRNLPPDHPLEPGSGAARGRVAGSPGDRIAASEAALAGAKQPLFPDPGSQSNFIAAARRAALAADRDASAKPEAAEPSEIATAAGRRSKRMGKPRALIGATSLILIVLVSIHIARTWLGVSDPMGMSAELGPAAVAEPREVSPPGAAASDLAASRDAPSTLAPAEPVAGHEPPPATAADAPLQPLPAPVIPLEAGRPVAPAAGTAPSSDITGSILPPANPPAVAVSPPRATPASPPAQMPAPAEQLPLPFGAGLSAAAAKGNPAAQYEIALRYAEGRGVAQDLTEAAIWFERAAKQGLAPAQFRLGGLHEKGLGVKKNVDLARRYYGAAGTAGNAKALHNLGVLHAEGIDGKPNYPTAARWFRKAADYGITDSQYNLAVLYAHGIGVELNLAEAYKWFTLAARRGDMEAAKKRDEIAARLDPQTLAAAKQAVQSWKPHPQREAAVQVRTPSEGWDAPPAAAPPAASSKRKPRVGRAKLDLAPAPPAQ